MANTITNVVYELQDILGSYWLGIQVSCLQVLEMDYLAEFDRSLDYESLGVSNIEELVVKMGDMVLWWEDRESKEKHVSSARMLELRQRLFLKLEVKKLLNRHRGEIEFNSFEDSYKDQFKEDLDYDFYGLTNLDHLCEVLKDILVVEVANASGENVIKAVNLRKRKRDDD